MKAVILARTVDTAVFPFADYYPPIAFPIANKPLITHLLGAFKKNKIKEVAIILPDHLGWDKSVIKKLKDCKLEGMQISWFEEKNPKGTAGVLKELEGFIDSSPFLLMCSNMFIGDLKLSEIFKFHLTKKAGITLVVEKGNMGKEHLENIEIDKNGFVKTIHILHHSRNNRQLSKPSGLYIFDPIALDSIFEVGYMDLKEQLIPRLNDKNIPVCAYAMEKPIRKIDSFTDYFQLNKEVLLGDMNNKKSVCQHKTQIMNQVWVGRNVKISPNAYIVGPVIIDDNCTIDNYSQVIGPTCIGSGSHIRSNVLVRESIIWENTRLMNRSRVEYSIIGENCTIPNNETTKNGLVIQDKKYNGNFNFAYLYDNSDAKIIINENGQLTPISHNFLKHKIFLVTKRLIDVFLSGLGLLFLVPVFLIMALAIKIDSPGPVVFPQTRCGKDGKEFKMYKLRTMVNDAEKLQTQLFKHKNVDGPMFKMKGDPRVTKVGKLLRKTSADELPQLFNVLKGEMSLIGPRPLVMEEMKFASGWREIRLKVQPGITGLWQINGRSGVSFHDWIQNDLYYVRNQSLKLDFKIFIKTITTVVRFIGAI